MKKAKLNQPIPDVEVESTSGERVSLSDFTGQNVVLYFYPKDNTPGCTQEGLDFNANLAKFKRRKTVVLGVSRDTLASHEKFINKQGFKFDLLADPDETLCKIFDVIKMKNMYGKQVRGIERSTFLIDGEGVLRHEWRKVKVKGHVDEVLSALKTL